MSSILSLDRNDTNGALKYAEERLKSGEFNGDDAEQLLMLQDDPDELTDELSALIEQYRKDGSR